MTAVLVFHYCEGQRWKTMSTDHNFWRERTAEAESNRGTSAHQPNALPLGQASPQPSSSRSILLKPTLLGVEILHGNDRRSRGVRVWPRCLPCPIVPTKNNQQQPSSLLLVLGYSKISSFSTVWAVTAGKRVTFVQCCFTSTETPRTASDRELSSYGPRALRKTWDFLLSCCGLTSTEVNYVTDVRV